MNNWALLALGCWVLISPWVLGFSSISIMKWSNVIAGIALVLINVWIIFGTRTEGASSNEPADAERSKPNL
ncbi:hypothetical protein C4587_02395 [Candidatus Parcubacteria bacterium]|nr:MAG: hypothetical protein C4587_02395 [Candidatus Parcubacteria bacterium]